MPQSMLALLALVLVTGFAVRHAQQLQYRENRALQQEAELIAVRVASDWLEVVGSMPYDEATKTMSGTDTLRLTAPTQLTATANFRSDAGGDDIDDFDNTAVDTSVAVGGQPVRFHITTEVEYAEESSPGTGTTDRTAFKLVTATISSPAEERVRVFTPITVSRSFACGARCDW